jgi:hypothetical protein
MKDNSTLYSKPSVRKLRAYAFDPSLSLKLDTSVINDITYKVRWESVSPGPIGEYIEVVDYDPSSGCFYTPVDLNDQFVLAQDGLDPDESNPHFHQQMVYAVAMTTIRNFEIALGRKVMWSQYRYSSGYKSKYVQRLRIYPHALREANAYYSPQKKALLFGYFNAMPESPSLAMPGGTVYTCLSHDIIAHEITHALLDGMHRRYVEATHIDSLAFHEAFADIVALFQHFTFPEVLKQQIAQTRGDLGSQNLLGQLAQEFGKAIGHYGSLRDAIGEYDQEKEEWRPKKADPREYQLIKEPHARGAILVATIFDAFINIYKKRVADLLRIASGGSGVLIPGSLHPDLVNRLAKEASKTSEQVLRMCIRALDYCPPMDINFGDYLRALITADYDLVEEDDRDYRIAIIEAFQKRGIFPDTVTNLSVESLLYKADSDSKVFEEKFASLIEFFKLFKEKVSYVTDRQELYELTKVFIAGGDINRISGSESRKPSEQKDRILGLHQRLTLKFMSTDATTQFEKLTSLKMADDQIEELGFDRSERSEIKGMPSLEVHNLKLVTRVGPKGNLVNQILVTLTQRRGVVCATDEYGNVEIKGFFSPRNPTKGWYERVAAKRGKKQTYTYTKKSFPIKNDKTEGTARANVLPKGWFIFRGGATLLFDLNYASSKDNVKLKYIIKKDIDDEARIKRQYTLLYSNKDFSLNATYFGAAYGNLEAEPFAIIHKVL